MRKGLPAIFILIYVLFMTGTLQAQWRKPTLTQLGPKEGLNATIIGMAQDSSNFIYLATNVGLYKYDSHTFQFFGHDPMDPESIGQGDVNSIITSRDGKIWLTLRFGGLNSMDPHTNTFRRYPIPSLSFRNDLGAHAIFEDKAGMLWVGAGHFRLFSFDRATEQYTTYTPDWIDAEKDGGRLMIISIVEDKHDPDILWLSVLDYASKGAFMDSYGLVSFNKKTKLFKDYPCFGCTKFQDSTGVLWGSYWGNFISRFDPLTLQCDTIQHFITYKGQQFGHVSHDVTYYQNELYATFSKALVKLNIKGHFDLVAEPDLREVSYTNLFTDRDDNLWIGSSQGAYIMDPNDQHIRFFSLEEFGTVNRIFPGRLAYYPPDDVIYLSHPQVPGNTGFYTIPLEENKAGEASFTDLGYPVTGIAVDYRSRIWLFGDGSFQLLDPHTRRLTRTTILSEAARPFRDVQHMSSTADGWIGAIGSEEFVWFHADTQKIHRLRIEDLPGSDYAKSFGNGFDGFTLGPGNKAYLFSNEVHLVDLTSGKATPLKYDLKFNPNLQRVQYVGEDAEGNIWMSTFTLIGKYRLLGDSLIMLNSYTIKDGMISPVSTELHNDEHQRVWCFTNQGINCIDPVSGEIRYFGTKEGLPLQFIDPRQVISTADGRIATVCDNGLIVFDPDKLWNSVAPSAEHIVIKKIRISGAQLTADQLPKEIPHIHLKPVNNGMDIEFQALAFPTDYRIEYSYRIAGLQPEWISIGNNKLVTIPSLSPGEYTFEVKVGHPQSQSAITGLHIFVATPVFQQTWFIVLSLIGIGSCIYLLVAWWIRRVRKEEAERTEISKKFAELELKALRAQMNPHFMFNSLNSIKNYILHAEPKLAAEYLSNFAHLIRMILQNSREKTISLQEELETLILYIELEQIRFEKKFEFNCIIEDGLHMESIMIPPMILQPFIENAIWHGLMHKKETGHLMLEFSRDGNMISCIIDDDGVGRNKASEMKDRISTKYKSMGMGITHDRIAILNKMDALGITSEIIDKYDATGIPTGTKVIIRIPGSQSENLN